MKRFFIDFAVQVVLPTIALGAVFAAMLLGLPWLLTLGQR